MKRKGNHEEEKVGWLPSAPSSPELSSLGNLAAVWSCWEALPRAGPEPCPPETPPLPQKPPRPPGPSGRTGPRRGKVWKQPPAQETGRCPRPDWGPGLGDLAEDAGCTGKLASEQPDLSGEGGLSRSGALLSLGWLNHSWEEPRLQPPEGLSSSKSC